LPALRCVDAKQPDRLTVDLERVAIDHCGAACDQLEAAHVGAGVVIASTKLRANSQELRQERREALEIIVTKAPCRFEASRTDAIVP